MRPALLALAISVSWPASAAPLPSVAQILRDVGEGPIEDEHHAEILAGRLVVSDLTDVSDRELAVGAACLVSRSPAEVLAPLLAPRPLGAPDELEHVERISEPHAEDALAGLTLGPGDAEEAARYAAAQPGFELNLAEHELPLFAGLAGHPDLVPRVERALRDQLGDRLRAYAQSGLAGTPPYARGGGEHSRPAQELHRSFNSPGAFADSFPLFARIWNHYPAGELRKHEEAFFWSRARVDKRPAFFLSHLTHRTTPERGIAARRSFYWSHFFDAAFEIAGVVDTHEGRLFFFVRRVWVDRWNGMGSVKRRLGHRLIAGEVREEIEANGICR